MQLLCKSVLILIFSLISTTFCDPKNDDDGASDLFVMGAQHTDIIRFPYMAAFSDKIEKNIICSGSIISSNWILTAAHCFNANHTEVTLDLRVGSTYGSSGGEIYPIKAIYQHPDYERRDNMATDIALVHAGVSIKFRKNVKAIPLPEANQKFQLDFQCFFYGYGYTKDPIEDQNPARLRYLGMPIVEDSVCTKEFQQYSNETMVCSGFMIKKASPCMGDSGGPLFCGDVLYGVHSRATMACAQKGPSVFVSVPKFLKWITEVTDK